MTDRLAAAVTELVAALRDELRAETAQPAPDRLLSVDEAGVALGLGRSKIYDLVRSGDLASLKAGRRRLVSAGAVRDFIAAGQADR